jgi:tyrosine-protein phosphatase YwqE
MQNLGYKKIICTPHVISDVHPNTPVTIGKAYELLKARLKAENIAIELGFAAEYMINHEFDDILKDGKVLHFGKEKYALIEMSYLAESLNIKEAIFELMVQGYKPILAHPERYNYYHFNNKKILEFVDVGCLLQLNLLSLTGYYGKPAKETALWLMKQKHISFVGTDLHHDRHLLVLQKLAADKNITGPLRDLGLKNNLI